MKDYRQLLPEETFDLLKFQNGDLLISFSDYFVAIHPGHLALVVVLPLFDQRMVWDLALGQDTFVLTPLSAYVERAWQINKKIFVRHLRGPGLRSDRLIPTLRRYSSVRFKAQATLDHISYLLHRICGLPGLPHLSGGKDEFYCSELIMEVLIHVGIIVPTYREELTNSNMFTPTHLVYPYMLIETQDWLAKATCSPYFYDAGHKITLA